MITKSSLCVLALGLAIIPSVLKAEETNLLTLSLQDLLKVQVEVATKNKKTPANSPSTVSVFTANEINNLGITTLQELLNLVPGFQVYNDGTNNDGSSLSARGRRASNSSFEILILYDGQRLNEGRSGGASIFNTKIALENIERVEIIRGPGSAIYGSNAFTSIINLVTKTDANNINVAMGQYGAISGSLNYSRTLENGTLSAFVKSFTQDGEEFNLGSGANSQLSRRSNSGVDFYTQYSSDNLNLRLKHMERKSDGLYVVERVNDDFNKMKQNQNHINGDYSWSLNDELSLKAGGYFFEYEIVGGVSLLPAGAFAIGGDFFGLSNPSSSDTFDTEFNFVGSEIGGFVELAWNVSENSEMLFGLTHREEDAEESIVKNNFDLGMFANGQFPINYYGELLPTTLVQTPQKRNISGLFAQYDSKINDQLLLTIGGRFDDYSDFGNTFNPRLGMVYKVNDEHTLKLSYGKAFRAPASEETHLQNNPVIEGNLNLKPEQIKTIELHWSQHYETIDIGLTLFDNTITDAVAQLPSPNSNLLSWQNGDEYHNSGGEIELVSTLSDSVLMRASLTQFFDLPVESQKQSEEMFTLAVNYHCDPWNINFNGFSHGEMSYMHPEETTSTLVRVKLDSYMVFNLNLAYQLSKNSTIQLNTKNIFDEKYFTPTATGLLPAGIANDGRSLHLSLEYRF